MYYAGWALMMPEKTTAQPTCAAGSISIITGPIIPGGHGPVGGGPTMPLGAMESCDIGSPFRAAGNIERSPRYIHSKIIPANFGAIDGQTRLYELLPGASR